MKARTAGELLIPLLASAYAIYMIWEQLSGSYRASTINYALLTGGGVLVFSALVIFRVLFSAAASDDAEQRIAIDPEHRGRIIRGVAVLALACLLVFTFEQVGYAAGFLGFAFLTLLILDVRSPALLIGVPVVTVVIVHFIFVGWFALPLPRGVLGGLL